MSLALWLGLARDVAAVLAIAAALLSVATFWSSEAGLGGGLAASVLIVSLAGVGALALHGLLSGGAGLPGGAVAVAMAALLLAGSFYGAHVFGVRGLWVASLSLVGVAFAWGLIWAFGGRIEAYASGAGPILALLLLTLVAVGALGAVADRQSRLAAAAAAGRGEPMLLAARRLLATPPPWFDCVYATLGGEASAPGECAFTPPKVASSPNWAAAGEPPAIETAETGAAAKGAGGLDASGRASGHEEAAEARPPEFAAKAPEAAPPAAPSLANPEFDTGFVDDKSHPPSPGILGAPGNADAPPARGVAPEGESAAASPEAAEGAEEGAQASAEVAGPPAPGVVEAPSGIAAPNIGHGAPPQPASPGGERAPQRLASTSPASVIEPSETRSAAGSDSASAPERSSSEPNRLSSAFVCFPMTSLAADRLCPDQRFGVEDLSLRWVMEGGEALDDPKGVECAVDRGLGLHATLFVNLSGDLAGSIAALPGEGAPKLRKAEALYDAATRMVGGMRGAAEQGAETRMSLYVAGGSSLLSPWAEQSFSPERADRLFDLASSGQALSLLRRLKSDTQSVRKNTVARDLGAELAAMAAERPSAEAERPRSVVILVTDALAAELLDAKEAEVLGAAFAAAELPVVSIEIGHGAPSPTLARLAERSGGSAYSAGDGEALYQRLARSLEQARRFCAVRVTGPDRFFREGALELRLRRRMTDGCALEQIATVSCDGLSFDERIEPAAD